MVSYCDLFMSVGLEGTTPCQVRSWDTEGTRLACGHSAAELGKGAHWPNAPIPLTGAQGKSLAWCTPGCWKEGNTWAFTPFPFSLLFPGAPLVALHLQGAMAAEKGFVSTRPALHSMHYRVMEKAAFEREAGLGAPRKAPGFLVPPANPTTEPVIMGSAQWTVARLGQSCRQRRRGQGWRGGCRRAEAGAEKEKSRALKANPGRVC